MTSKKKIYKGEHVKSLHNYKTHTRARTHTHTHTHAHTQKRARARATRWQDGQVRTPEVSPADEHPAESSHNTKYKNPPYTNSSVFSPLSLYLSPPFYRLQESECSLLSHLYRGRTLQSPTVPAAFCSRCFTPPPGLQRAGFEAQGTAKVLHSSTAGLLTVGTQRS